LEVDKFELLVHKPLHIRSSESCDGFPNMEERGERKEELTQFQSSMQSYEEKKDK
jgi:hypothetical protein